MSDPSKHEVNERFRSELEISEQPIGADGAQQAASTESSRLIERLRRQGRKGERYRILDEVAQGGMGVIWKIWDEDLRRTLAMKVVLAKGAEPSGETPAGDAKTLGRFLEEAQVTGQLDHPGIVPVHELGLAADDRIYFTMRLVQGRDLSQVFDLVLAEQQGWSKTRALGVLLKICEAMSYAHAKGVIHRDLKPANVMVGNYGEVYVMDWGVARVLGTPDAHDVRIHAQQAAPSEVRTDRGESRGKTPDSVLATMDGDVVGTPAYMPPEQAKGELERLGPHSDVYALGAMLYHLLAGQMPYVSRDSRTSQLEIWKRVIAGPPRALRELAPQTPAELIAICERAMAREASQRYRDMQELADDLRAYLERRVVRAYATGTWAETKKWVQRNKAFACSLAAAVLAVAAGGIGFAIQARRANLNAVEASAKATEAQVARTAAEDNARLAHENERIAQEREREAAASAARAEKVTELVRKALSSSDPNQGGSQEILVVDAMKSAILELESGVLAEDPQTEAALQEAISSILDGNGRSEEALHLAQQALATRQRLFPGDHLDVLTSAQNVAACLETLGRSTEALPLREMALAMSRRLFAGDHEETAGCLNNLATNLGSLGRPADALSEHEAALAMYRRLFSGDHENIAASLGNTAACLESLGRPADALPMHEAALEMRRRLYQGDHRVLAANLNNVAACLQMLGRSAEALPKAQAGLEMIQRLFQGDHPEVATSLNNVAACLSALGRDAQALPMNEAALEMRQRLYTGDHPIVAASLSNLGVGLGLLGRAAEALPKLEAALEMYERLFPGDHPEIAQNLDSLAMCLKALGRSAEALPHFERALEMRERLYAGDHPEVALSLCNLASCLDALGQRDEALPPAELAQAMAERVLPDGHPWRAHIAATLERLRAPPK